MLADVFSAASPCKPEILSQIYCTGFGGSSYKKFVDYG